MIRLHGHRTGMPRIAEYGVTEVADIAFVKEARAFIAELRVSDEVLEYIVDMVRATREHPSLLCGASPRATNMLATAARALAARTSPSMRDRQPFATVVWWFLSTARYGPRSCNFLKARSSNRSTTIWDNLFSGRFAFRSAA